ncbi:MAG: tetratricopeptide repeat protein, partial [Candidatus Thorarchaeota archaeon]
MTSKIKELIEEAEKLASEQNFIDALEILEKLFKDNPQSEETKQSLVKTLFIYGGYLNDEYILQYDKAKQLFKRIIEIDPENYRAHYNLGIANFNLENMEQAKQCYEEAIRIKPDYKHCFYNMGLVYEREGNLQEALKYYEIALDIDPNFPYAYNARNQILSNLGRLKKDRKDSRKKQNLEQLKSLLE